MSSGGKKTNITQSTFYSKPYDEIRKKHSSIVEYELDHLATLTISLKDQLETAEDGFRRLQKMISTSEVSSMRINLRLSPKEAVVLEKRTGKELETFPVKHIYDPVCYPNSSDQCKHILIFTVRGDTVTRSRNEMHIFQSVNAEEETIVDDLKAANIGMFPRTRDSVSPINQRPIYSSRSIYEEDVNLLNSCLEFIENFVTSLQKSARAHKQLMSREETDKNHELEYLTKQSMPPPNDDFIEVLRQFKFTFNLLPKLKSFLKDPNSLELARDLFRPLALVVDSCRDNEGKAKLPAIITSPLLTADACNLLHSCLLPSQMILWKELGDAWSTPLEKWTGSPPEPYYPSFRSSSKINSSMATTGKGSSSEQIEYLKKLKAKKADIYQTKVTRIAEPIKVKELSIEEGEYLEMLLNPAEKGWWKVANVKGQEGFVPKTIIQKIYY